MIVLSGFFIPHQKAPSVKKGMNGLVRDLLQRIPAVKEAMAVPAKQFNLRWDPAMREKPWSFTTISSSSGYERRKKSCI